MRTNQGTKYREAYMARKHIVIKTEDVEAYLSPYMRNRLYEILYAVALGRKADGKEPDVPYIAYPHPTEAGFDFKRHGADYVKPEE